LRNAQPEDIVQAAANIHGQDDEGDKQNVHVELLRMTSTFIQESMYVTVDECIFFH